MNLEARHTSGEHLEKTPNGTPTNLPGKLNTLFRCWINLACSRSASAQWDAAPAKFSLFYRSVCFPVVFLGGLR